MRFLDFHPTLFSVIAECFHWGANNWYMEDIDRMIMVPVFERATGWKTGVNSNKVPGRMPVRWAGSYSAPHNIDMSSVQPPELDVRNHSTVFLVHAVRIRINEERIKKQRSSHLVYVNLFTFPVLL